MHAHSDLNLLHTPEHEAKISQGVTTEVIGQDGIGYAPVDDECLKHIRRQIAGWNGNPKDDGFVSSFDDLLDLAFSEVCSFVAFCPFASLDLVQLALNALIPGQLGLETNRNECSLSGTSRKSTDDGNGLRRSESNPDGNRVHEEISDGSPRTRSSRDVFRVDLRPRNVRLNFRTWSTVIGGQEVRRILLSSH